VFSQGDELRGQFTLADPKLLMFPIWSSDGDGTCLAMLGERQTNTPE